MWLAGLIESDMSAAMTEKQTKDLLQRVALQRIGKPEEVAHVAEFLVNATYLTGEVRIRSAISATSSFAFSPGDPCRWWTDALIL